MLAKKTAAKKEKREIVYHKDGTVWARGQSIDGVPTGYWEWFRKDGTKLRSGSFENGEQVGEWATYDKQGQVYKVTTIKAKKK
jgi:antitoxin component YwqK of YwqJK toxin-antitoxin module